MSRVVPQLENIGYGSVRGLVEVPVHGFSIQESQQDAHGEREQTRQGINPTGEDRRLPKVICLLHELIKLEDLSRQGRRQAYSTPSGTSSSESVRRYIWGNYRVDCQRSSSSAASCQIRVRRAR